MLKEEQNIYQSVIKKLINLENKKYLEFVFLIALGALTSLSLPPYNYLLINFLTISLFFIYIFQKKKLNVKKHTFLYGWLFGFVIF
jgi:apolipoprotein N-acyltransferase